MIDTEGGVGRGILVVEDDEQLQSALTYALSQHGYAVTVARDGYEGLERMEREAPWLVLTDLNLPGKGGMDFTGSPKPGLPYAGGGYDRVWWSGCRSRGS